MSQSKRKKLKRKQNSDAIHIHGARVHNLQNIDVDIPKNKLVVVCGVSGSGKSSLAFDTLYEEGQRRYLEGLSSYVRQFLGGFKKPDVEKIVGLSPTLAINQKSVSTNPRSTVGTITEIYDHLRLLFARVGVPYCPEHNEPIVAQTPQEITEKIARLATKHEVLVLAPLVQGKKGEHRAIMDQVAHSGYRRVRIDGFISDIDEALGIELDKNKVHSIEVVVGAFDARVQTEIRKNLSSREKQALKKRNQNIKKAIKEEKAQLLEVVRRGLMMGNGTVIAYTPPKGTHTRGASGKSTKGVDVVYSENYSCPKCGFSIPKVEPRSFSFNNPFGACENCQGLGTTLEIDIDRIIAPEVSLEVGAIKPWYSLSRVARRSLGTTWQKFVTQTILEQNGIDKTTPFKDIPKDVQDLILYGDKEKVINLQDGDWKGKTRFEGVIPRLERLYYETDSDFIRHELSKYMSEHTCPVCKGARIKKEFLSVLLAGKNIFEIASMPIGHLVSFFSNTAHNKLSVSQKTISAPIIKEIVTKAKFLIDVGLDYMTIARSATTLSVGENQRIRLATHLGSGLSGVVYVLDEPTIGLHASDTDRLINTLKHLRDMGNTVVVVEHDERVLEEADWIIEIGPSAGEKGGKLVFQGTPKQLLRSNTLTGQYLSGKKKVSGGGGMISRNESNGTLTLYGASQFNLKNVTFRLPTQQFVAVVGVSGSGKSTLVLDVFAKALQKEVSGMSVVPGAYEKLEGKEAINKVVMIDQSPIGRTPRSNPATYTGVLTPIRQLYARLEESQLRGYTPSHFSFNVKPGRCEACRGEGFKKVEMYFLPDMYVECEVCKGKRFSLDVLDVHYKDKSIADVLDMTISHAHEFFKAFPTIADKLALLESIGLGYMKLGQPATTLSGGEAQRIKLADELSKRATGKTLYVLDEPTVGLHFDDVSRLLFILRSLVKKGNTVLIIEHNMSVIKEADWIVELGPGGGERGGKIIAEGTRDDIIRAKTITGKYLKEMSGDK